MTDLKITKKHPPTGSLVRRILVIAILLLVIPLFLQSLFLYRQEYNQKLGDVEADLRMLGKERVHFIQEIIRMDWVFLDAQKNERVFGGNVKQLYMERIPLPQGVSEHFLLVNRGRNALLVGKRESNTSALVIPIPFSLIARDMPSAYPIQLSLIESKEKTVWESRKFTEASGLVQVKIPIPETPLTFRLAIEKKQLHALHLESYYFRFATLVLFIGIIGGGAVYFFTRRIARPLKDLCKTMDRVSEGAVHARYTPDWMGFEINALGIQFNETLDALLRHSQEAERERLTRERLAEELRIGHEIQANLLPSHVPGLPGIDIATGYFSAKEVNGDFYDLFRLDNGQLLLAICDTAGKGIPACLFSLSLRSMVRSFASVTADVAELVRKVNDLYLIDAHEPSMFSTLWLGLYEPEKRRLVYCSQGHPPALLRRGGHLEELWTGGIALGAQKIDLIPTKEVALVEGDLLVLYTDGIIEAHDPDKQLFGKKRLHEFILRKRKETCQQIADQLIEEIHLFTQGSPQHDDMTLVVMHIAGK